MVADVDANRFGIALSPGVGPKDIEIDHVDIILVSDTVEPGHRSDGMYSIGFRNVAAKPGADLIIWVPPDAPIMGFVSGADGLVDITPDMIRSTSEGQEVHVPIASGLDPGDDRTNVNVSFQWRNPRLRSLGHERSEVQVGYSGSRFGFQPITPASLASDFTGNLSVGYRGDNDVWVSSIPPPDRGGFEAWAWDIDDPGQDIEVSGVVENSWTRRQVDLASNVFFLLLGAFIGVLITGAQSAFRRIYVPATPDHATDVTPRIDEASELPTDDSAVRTKSTPKASSKSTPKTPKTPL
jgi:hypothetical protein